MQSWKPPRTEGNELGLSRYTTKKVLQKLLKFQMYMDQLLVSLRMWQRKLTWVWWQNGKLRGTSWQFTGQVHLQWGCHISCKWRSEQTMSVSQKQEAKEQWLSIGGTAPKLPRFVRWGFQSSWTMYHYGNQGQPEKYWHHRQTNYLAFLGRLIMWCSSNLYSSNFFSLEQGRCIFLRAYAKFLDNF